MFENSNNIYRIRCFHCRNIPVYEYRLREPEEGSSTELSNAEVHTIVTRALDQIVNNNPELSLSELTKVEVFTTDDELFISSKIGTNSFKIDDLLPHQKTENRITRIFKKAISWFTRKQEWEDDIPLVNKPCKLTSEDNIDDDPYRIIEQAFDIEGKHYGSEYIERVDTLGTLRTILTQEKDYEALERLNSYTDVCESRGKQTEWIKSQDFRSECRHSGYERACKTFPLGAPVNLRGHVLLNKDNETVEQIIRLGAITDVSNGWMSLKELKEFREGILNQDNTLIQKKLDEIEKFIQSPSSNAFMQKILNVVFRRADKLRGERYASAHAARKTLQNILNEWNFNGNIKALDDLIDARRKNLRRQMLQYLSVQVESNPEKTVDGQPFNLFHLSLLNLHKKSLDSTGWMHDERVAFEDMREIMHEFDGKTLVLGEKGPLVEGDKIYLPSFEIEAEIPLNIFIFNLCPQGHIRNDNPQLGYNNQELGRLRTTLPDFPLQKAQDLIGGSRTGYDVAEDFILQISDYLRESNSGALSDNCASGKDRTGYICARLMMNRLTKLIPDNANPFESKILDEDYPATKVARDNIPKTRVLKLDPRTINKLGIRGFKKSQTISFIFRQSVIMATQEIPT